MAVRDKWRVCMYAQICRQAKREADVITRRVVRAPRKGLSPSRRASRRPLGARDASQACAGVDAGRARSVKAGEALRRLWTQGSTRIELGAWRPCTSLTATVPAPLT